MGGPVPPCNRVDSVKIDAEDAVKDAKGVARHELGTATLEKKAHYISGLKDVQAAKEEAYQAVKTAEKRTENVISEVKKSTYKDVKDKKEEGEREVVRKTRE